MNNLIVDKVSGHGLIYGYGRYEIRLRYAQQYLKQHRIFKYDNKEVIIIETLPTENKFTIIVTDINDFDWQKEIDVIKFFDNCIETDYILE